MIVEDEKMIRLGIKAMVMKSSVPIQDIILCKNGEEAYEILKSEKIDVMITDIRMPKMDGITLVREIQSLPNIPKVIVISGYDDFSYAVELMHYGAKDYILKPVEREKMNELLRKMEEELELENKQEKKLGKIGCQQFKYMLLNSNISAEEIKNIEEDFKDYFLKVEYIVCCTNYRDNTEIFMKEVLFLEDVNGQSIFIVNVKYKEELINHFLKGYYVGISRKHQTIQELREAYKEAFFSRKYAFATTSKIIEFSCLDIKTDLISEEMIEQVVQMVGTDKLEEANKLLGRLFFKTKIGSIEPDYFYSTMNDIIDRICETYKNLLDLDGKNVFHLKNLYDFDNAESYYKALSDWIASINEKMLSEYDDYKNKQKIQKAVSYIQENFNKDLNMAVVSNFISMNYSLFSYIFKQYTGMNFVSYLKFIRISEAKRLLEKTDQKIIDISMQIGYENEKHFMKIFKSVCGISPSEYRKNVLVGKVNSVM